METVLQIAALALVATCLCLVVRGQAGSIGMLLSLAACVGIFAVSMRFISPVLEILKRLRDLTGLADAATAPMIKVAGIGLLSQVAGAVCEDAGEKALSRAVEVSGAVLSLYTALPLLSSVLDLLEETLGG